MTQHYSNCLDSDTNSILKIYLFKNIRNVDVIRNNIKNGVWKCAAIKPSLILDPFQVAVAANRAAVAKTLDNMVTRTVYGEILYNLSLTKNISQSLLKFGADKDKALLLCFLTTEADDDSKAVVNQIDGEVCPISELSSYTDLEEIKSVYKLSNLKSEEDLLDNIISRMVTKNFVSFTDVSSNIKY